MRKYRNTVSWKFRIRLVGKGNWKEGQVGKFKVGKFSFKSETERNWKVSFVVGKLSFCWKVLAEVGDLK